MSDDIKVTDGTILEALNGKVDLDGGNYTGSGLEAIVKKNGGGGLELCDIGMALYVDETKGLRRWLNGQIVAINQNTQGFLTRLKKIVALYPSLLTTEENWQAAKTLSDYGQVGKFVFNYAEDEKTVESVRLPAVVNVQGLLDLQNLGMTVEAGLPNIKSENIGFVRSGPNIPGRGAIKVTSRGRYAEGAAVNKSWSGTFALNAADSSSYYKDGATVQSEAIQYPYFIQIATGAETENNIINEIELNNPYSLFDSKYSDHELNNLSWLKSEGQWNAKAVYTDAYDKLLKVYNGTETVEGLSVKLSTETYTDYDFVLNTADETFRLPLLDGSEDLLSDRYDDLELKASGSTYTAPANGWFWIQKLSSSTGQYLTPVIKDSNGNIKYTLTSQPTAAGYDAEILAPVSKGDVISIGYNVDGATKSFRFIYARGNGSLYYYVGETVQNANLINAGRIEEKITDVLRPTRGFLIEKYENGTSWYRVYSDGFCVQGWRGVVTAQITNKTLLKPYRDVLYTIVGNQVNIGNAGYHTINVSQVSATTIQIRSNPTGSPAVAWFAMGYVNL